jgi:hypothetical protein
MECWTRRRRIMFEGQQLILIWTNVLNSRVSRLRCRWTVEIEWIERVSSKPRLDQRTNSSLGSLLDFDTHIVRLDLSLTGGEWIIGQIERRKGDQFTDIRRSCQSRFFVVIGGWNRRKKIKRPACQEQRIGCTVSLLLGVTKNKRKKRIDLTRIWRKSNNGRSIADLRELSFC